MQSFIFVSTHTLEQIRKERKSSVRLKLKLKLMGCRSTYGNHLIFMRESKQGTKRRIWPTSISPGMSDCVWVVLVSPDQKADYNKASPWANILPCHTTSYQCPLPRCGTFPILPGHPEPKCAAHPYVFSQRTAAGPGKTGSSSPSLPTVATWHCHESTWGTRELDWARVVHSGLLHGMPRATYALYPLQAPNWQPTAPQQHRHNKVGLQPTFQVERTDRCSHQALTSEVHLLRYANPALGVSWEQQWFQRAQGPLSLQQLRTMTQLPNLGRQLSRKLRRTRLFHHLKLPSQKGIVGHDLGVVISICYYVLCVEWHHI